MPRDGVGVIEPKPRKKRTKKAPSPASPTRGVSKPSANERVIRVRGAKEHNLKNVDLTLPRDRLIVMTGLSGSGKSSLAFDTIFAEGQRKYMESLSAYARQFLDQIKKPDVEEVEGIPPTIAIEQRSSAHNPRSTVATTTEIYDYLRLLYARCGTAYSWAPKKTKKDGTITERRGVPITASSATQIVDAIMSRSALRADSAATDAQRIDSENRSTRMMILAPVVRTKKGFHKDTLESLQSQGWGRARVNGEIIELREALKEGGENPLNLGRHHKHDIEAVIDRIVLKDTVRQRLSEAIESALKIGEGSVIVSVQPGGTGVPPVRGESSDSGIAHGRDARATGKDASPWTDNSFSDRLADPEHPEYAISELAPRLFSFNSPHGACPTCHGLGAILEFDEELVIPDEEKTLQGSAIAPWKKNGPGGMIYPRMLRRYCRASGLSPATPIAEMHEDDYDALMHGDPDSKWSGVLPMLRAWFDKTESTWVKDHLHQFMAEHTCPECLGDRLRIEALHVQLESDRAAQTDGAMSSVVIGRPTQNGTMLNISELSRLTITDAIRFIEGLKLTSEQQHIAEPILREVANRLRFLTSVGLDYLSLDRRTSTLSGGEAQRIRLATQVGSGLVGACYVLDEPTIGLHPRDNTRLIATLRHLTDIGNTVLVVEHDEEMIRAADHVVDIGPGAGVHGGRIVAQGTIDDVAAEPESLTGDYLADRRRIEIPEYRRKLSERKAITLKGAKANNLKSIDASFPLGGMLCVTGVSGSGKSTLVNEILLKVLKKKLLGTRVVPGEHTRLNGSQHVDRVIEVDQSPIGRTPRSNPATYTGIFDEIRKLFSQTKEAKIRAYKPGRFSFNVSAQNGGGRCEACQGQGLKKIEMHFLADVFVECEVCRGKRYNRETLEVLYRGKSIADVLDMTIEKACGFFENHPKVLRFCECLRDVGLGYVTLGQPSTTLSGGEAQRVKLATELGKGGGTKNNPTGYTNILYVLDEPTTGLHFEDVRKLLTVLTRLVESGNTVLLIEHNLDVIKCADWIIDLGPEGGEKGGMIVAQGPPEKIAKSKKGYTAEFLKRVLC